MFDTTSLSADILSLGSTKPSENRTCPCGFGPNAFNQLTFQDFVHNCFVYPLVLNTKLFRHNRLFVSFNQNMCQRYISFFRKSPVVQRLAVIGWWNCHLDVNWTRNSQNAPFNMSASRWGWFKVFLHKQDSFVQIWWRIKTQMDIIFASNCSWSERFASQHIEQMPTSADPFCFGHGSAAKLFWQWRTWRWHWVKWMQCWIQIFIQPEQFSWAEWTKKWNSWFTSNCQQDPRGGRVL